MQFIFETPISLVIVASKVALALCSHSCLLPGAVEQVFSKGQSDWVKVHIVVTYCGT